MAYSKLFKPDCEHFQDYFARIFQSSNINFLFGAGASNPAIMVAGDIETRIQQKYDIGQEHEAEKIEYELLEQIQSSTVKLLEKSATPPENDVYKVLANYQDFIAIIQEMLQSRHNSLLPKKINIFTTNYDLFVEKSALQYKGLILNDGFQIRSSLNNEYQYDTRSFSRVFSEISALYDYKVEIPVINLIKMHGSLSWTMDSSDSSEIKYRVNPNPLKPIDDLTQEQVKNELDKYYLIYPKKEKFKTTLLNHTYYDLMRIFSNELDKEQTILLAFGFSFLDEHIFDLTKRALKNSTLKLIIFAFNEGAKISLERLFENNNNVVIIYPQDENELRFEQFNNALCCYKGLGA